MARRAAVVLLALLTGCRSFEIRDLQEIPEQPLLKARAVLPMSAVVSHERDQDKLSSEESSVEVTQVFVRRLRESNVFETVRYPSLPGGTADINFTIDFVRTFDMHRGGNFSKNILLLASCFLLYPVLKIRVDYSIEGLLRVSEGQNILREYREKAASAAFLHFLAPVDQAADQLSQRTMEEVSRKLVMDIVKDEPLYLSLLVKRKHELDSDDKA